MNTAECGGCQGQGAHRRYCPQHPNYTHWLMLADMAEDLADQIGPNDMAAANTAYGLAGRLREHHREELARRGG